MQYFPLFVDTKNLNVLVVGAGEVAARKLALLVRTEASITVVAESACEEVMAMAAQNRIVLQERAIECADLKGIQVLYMATANTELNQKYSVKAKQLGIWVNVVDSPADCSFITPAIVDRGKLQIAISSSGAAPVVAGLIRTKIETWLPQSIAKLIEFASASRAQLKQALPSDISFRQFWYRFFKVNGFGFQEKTQDVFERLLNQIDADNNLTDVKQSYFIHSQRDITRLPISVLPILQQIDTVIYKNELPIELNELIRRDAKRVKITADDTVNDDHSGLTLLYAEKRYWTGMIELE